MPRNLTYDEIADLADVILQHEDKALPPFELARAILKAGYEKADPDEQGEGD